MRKREFTGEFLGTFIMVLFGCGAVAVTTLFSAHTGLFQIGIVWGIGVMLAIYMTRHLSCAHFNPAVTIAMMVSKRMNPRKVPTYLAAQFLGAFAAGITIYLLFSPSIAAYESVNGIVRGSFESVTTAKLFGEYYQQPGSTAAFSLPLAMGAEGFGTFLLVLVIFLMTSSCNIGKPDDNITPIFIGLTVTSIICLIGPLTQAGLNPARDFAPRIVALLFGWGKWAFPDGVCGFFFVYMLAPAVGGILAAILFTKVLEPQMRTEKPKCCE